MKKIPKVMTNTRVSESNGLARQIVDEYNKDDYSSDAYLTGLFDQLIKQNNALGSAIMRDKANSELAELDDVVDTNFTNLHGLSKGYTFHPDTPTAQSAQQLFDLIDKYGLEVKSKSYRAQYPLLNSLLTESKSDEYQKCMSVLPGCDVRFTQLETAVNTFINTQSDYNLAKDEEGEMEPASAIKKQVIELLNDGISLYLNAMQMANAAVYGDLAQFMANRISENNTAIRNRRK